MPLTGNKFKCFVLKNLGETQVFVDDIKIFFWNASQYQLKNIIDLLAYIEYLSSILKRFNGISTFPDNILI